VSRLVAMLVHSLVNRGGMKFIDPMNRIHRVDPKIPNTMITKDQMKFVTRP
jgi:hypothetical protein